MTTGTGTPTSGAKGSALGRSSALAFSVAAYAFFLATFCYLIGWVGDFLVPKTIDSGVAGATGTAIAVDVGFLALFGIQHTVMGRLAFKRWWTRQIPEAIERSVFVLFSSLILAAMAWQWRPLPDVVWSVEGPLAALLLALSFVGWGIVLFSTFLIDHFHLFGLRQTWCYFSRRPLPEPPFKEVALYRVCRHPLMLGFVIAFWFTPTMTVGHLLFAAVSTAYILVGIRIEERTLAAMHGEEYLAYKRRVRMLLPIPR